MDHDSLALTIVEMWGDLDRGLLPEQHDTLTIALGDVLSVDDQSYHAPEAPGGRGTIGFGRMKFVERKFYSIKMGNLNRDWFATATLAGAGVGGLTSLAAMIASGGLVVWPGLGAIVAAGLIMAGRLKTMTVPFGLDEATALSLAWDHARDEHGFMLAHVPEILTHLGEAESVYGNHGFSEAKLRNAMGALEAIGMVRAVNPDCFQLVEDVEINTGRTVKLYKARP